MVQYFQAYFTLFKKTSSGFLVNFYCIYLRFSTVQIGSFYSCFHVTDILATQFARCILTYSLECFITRRILLLPNIPGSKPILSSLLTSQEVYLLNTR